MREFLTVLSIYVQVARFSEKKTIFEKFIKFPGKETVPKLVFKVYWPSLKFFDRAFFQNTSWDCLNLIFPKLGVTVLLLNKKLL